MKQRTILGTLSLILLIAFFAAPWRAAFARPQVATTHSITLTWTASVTPGVTYTVYRATATAGPFVAVASGVAGVTFTDTTAVPGTAYFYEVDAVSTATSADSGPSNEVNGTEPSNPNPPTALVVAVK